MPTLDQFTAGTSFVAGPGSAREPAFRVAPHNIEAEQALLGAILVNNDAFDRVSDFLRSEHFSEELHRRIFDVASQLIRAGKLASPDHLEDLSRATTISAASPFRNISRGSRRKRRPSSMPRITAARSTISPCAAISSSSARISSTPPMTRRSMPRPARQIEDAERKLYSIAETGRYDGGFQRFSDALTLAVDMAAKAFERDGRLSGIATGLADLDRYMGGLQASDLVIVAGRPGMGKTALATNIAFNIAKAYEFEHEPDGEARTTNGGIVGFFSLEMSAEQLATRIIAEQAGGRLLQDPPRRHHRAGLPSRRRGGARHAVDPLLHRPDRRPLDRATDRAGAPPQAPAWSRRSRHRLSAIARRLESAQRQPGPGNHRDHHRPSRPWPRS